LLGKERRIKEEERRRKRKKERGMEKQTGKVEKGQKY